MNNVLLALLALSVCLCGFGAPLAIAQEEVPMPPAPQPTVPELFTIEGQFVRVAYNNEGYATLGYRTAQQSVGGEWLLLDLGITVREGGRNCTTVKRVIYVLYSPTNCTN